MKKRSAIKNDLFASHQRESQIDHMSDPLAGIEACIDFKALAASVDQVAPRGECAKGGLSDGDPWDPINTPSQWPTNSRIRFRATVPNTERLRWWLLSYGTRLEVLAPESLRHEMTVSAAETLQLYNLNADDS